MSWLLIIPLMIVCLFLNIRVYLAMFIGIIAYFLFFSSVPIEIAVQRLIAPTQSPSLLVIDNSANDRLFVSQHSGLSGDVYWHHRLLFILLQRTD